MNFPGDFIIDGGLLRSYRGSGGSVTVPAGVTAIGVQAFQGNGRITEVTLPGSVEKIDVLAFSDCYALRKVTLSEGLGSISHYAFSGCSSLTEIRLPNTVTYIGDRAFYGCEWLWSIRLPKGLRDIGDKAFEGCRRLRELQLPPNLRRIGIGAFSSCRSLTELVLPDSLEKLGMDAFALCEGLTRVFIPDGVRRIESSTFQGCRSLTDVRLPEGLTDIETHAFFGCVSLRELRLPPGLKQVAEWAFRGCRGLADEKGFVIIRGELTDYFGPQEAAVVPAGVTRIGSMAFDTRPGLLRVSLPASVRSVAPTAFSENELLIRVRRWFPDLTKAVKECRLTAIVTENTSLVPPELRRALRIGRAFAPASSLDSPDAKEDLAWLARYAASLRKEAFRLPELLHFLCDRKLIRPGSVDAYVAEARAGNDPETVALLLAYQAGLGAESMEKAREQKRRREDALLEARARRAARDLKEGIEGLTFVVSGPVRVTGSRTELRRRLAERGAKLGAAVTASADYLVAVEPGDEPEKLEKAAELGIPLLSWGEFRSLLDPKDG